MDEIIVWIKNGKFPKKIYDWMEWKMNGGWMIDGWWMKNIDEFWIGGGGDEVFGWLMGQL